MEKVRACAALAVRFSHGSLRRQVLETEGKCAEGEPDN